MFPKGYFPKVTKIPELFGKILALSQFNVFADENFDVAQLVQLFFDMVENIVGKGENAGIQHFLLFLQCFHSASFQGSLKVHVMEQRVI